MPFFRRVPIALAAFAALASTAAQAASSLSITGTADDSFSVYLATDVATPGASVWDKVSLWMSTETSPVINLVDGVNYYVLVDAYNNSGPAMFLADLAVTGGGFVFANGGAFLSTDTTHWTVSETGFTSATNVPFSAGLNSVALPIWGQQSGISAGAEAIWAYNADWANGQPGHAYFVTQLSAVTAVPEPETYGMLLAGLGVVGLMARRRKG